MEGSAHPLMRWTVRATLCSPLRLRAMQFPIPRSDASSQDALRCDSVDVVVQPLSSPPVVHDEFLSRLDIESLLGC